MQHPVRVDAREPERDEPRARLEPELRRLALARDQHPGRAVADLARAPGRDHTLGQERRAQRGQRLERTCPAEASRRPRTASPRAGSAPRPGRSRSRSGPRRSRRSRAGATRARTRRAPPARGSTPRRSPPPKSPAARSASARSSLSERSPPFEPIGTRDIISTPARDDEVELARPDRGRRVEVRLHRRAALAVDGRPGHRLRPAGDHRHHPADVPALLADLGHAAELDVLDLARIDILAREQAVQHLSGELVAADRGQRPVLLADRRPNRVDDQCVDARHHHRVEAPGPHALQLALAAVLEGDARAGHEVLDGSRHEHLARAGGGSDARSGVDGDSRRLPGDDFALAGVNADANLEAELVNQLGDGASAADRPGRSVEAREEPVAGSVDLAAAEACELLSDRGVVTSE